MALVGNLKDLKLPSLIQLNCMERNTAKLTIEYRNHYGFIYFHNGQVVHAEYEPDIGEQAVYRLLSLPAGNFKVEIGIRPPTQSIQTNWNNLLLEGLHHVDHLEKQNSGDHNYEHLFNKILTIQGLKSAYIINKDGKVVASTPDENSNDHNILAFTILESKLLGDRLSVELPEFICLSLNEERLIITPYNQLYLVLRTQPKEKAEIILPLIKEAKQG